MKKFIRLVQNKTLVALQWLNHALTPSTTTRRWLWLPAALLVAAAGAYLNVVSQSGLGVWVDATSGALVAVLLAILVALALLLTRLLLQRAGRHLGLLPIAAAITAAWLLAHIGDNFAYILTATLFTGACLLTVAGLLIHKKRLLIGSISFFLAASLSIPTILWFNAEQSSGSPVLELMPTNTTATTTALPFLETGPYDIAHFTYGSGNDKRRADYADNIRFQTESVDASAMLESWNGWRGRMRSRAWGFSANELPLNAQVWHPTALTTEAPRPLTLIVHGNSNMFNRSELGYAWLAEHLASRGHIVASVDQNFINGGGFLYGGLFPENDARGWLMLEHLKQWQQWNEDPDHPFYGRVDMNQITLMGHSRGGEAVYLAGVFNQLSHYPDDALIAFDYGFDISGIIAIAPIDGQFRPAGQSAVLGDTNFFTIHGGHDSDAFFFHGDRQYYRAQPNYQAGQFKASLYLHHANHGQFNTEWGQRDYAGLYGHALNTEVLLSGHAQRQAAKAFFTAFVEHADMRDTALFCGSDHAASTLSLDIAVTRCQTSDRTIIADFNNGPDLTKGTLPGVSIHAEDLSLWRQGPAPFRQGNRERNAVWIGWNEEENLNSESYYELAIPAGALSGQTLHLELAQMDQDPPDYHGDHSGLRPSADFIIEFKDVRGHTIQHRASDFGGLLPPLPARHTRENKLFGIFSIERMMPNIFAHHQVTEAVIQSISIPLGEGSMKADDIRSIRFIFNQGAAVIMLDEVSIS